MVKEDCEMEGGEWVKGYVKSDGTYVKSFCRKKVLNGKLIKPVNDKSKKITKRMLLAKDVSKPVIIWYDRGVTLTGKLEEHDGKFFMDLKYVRLANNGSWSKYEKFIGDTIEIDPSKIGNIHDDVHTINSKVEYYQKKVDEMIISHKPYSTGGWFDANNKWHPYKGDDIKDMSRYLRMYRELEEESKKW